MNKNLFISKMKLYGDSQSDLAVAIGVSLARLNAKINETGGAEFSQSEIRKIKERYALNNNDIASIFFNDAVS